MTTPRQQMLAKAQQQNPFLSVGNFAAEVGRPEPFPAVSVLDLDGRTEEPAEIPLFKLDGHTYTIPADPPAGFALKFLAALKDGVQEDRAAGQLLMDLLGEKVYAAMATSPKVKTSDFATVMKIVRERVLGPIMEELGK